MDFQQVLYGRRSIRSFTAEPVAEDTLAWLVEAASQAPSAVNAQPWAFTVVRDQSLLDRISAQAKAHMLATAAPGIAPSHFRDQLLDPKFHIFYHAPAMILISAVDAGPWAVEDCALAAENMMLAAYSKGLGSCWIGFAQGWLATDDGKRILGLSANHRPVAPIIVGHPQGLAAPVVRHAPHVRWIG